ncbi:MAG: hypothetical protein R2828_03920 [Saprospiraceae bacterium]
MTYLHNPALPCTGEFICRLNTTVPEQLYQYQATKVAATFINIKRLKSPQHLQHLKYPLKTE